MRNQFRIGIAILIVVIIGGVIWQMAHPHPPDPIYQGKPLSKWLKDFQIHGNDKGFDAASDAVLHIGTNALPMLFTMLGSQDAHSAWASVSLFINRKQHLVHLSENPGHDRRVQAVFGFKALGSVAKPAVSRLAQIHFKYPDNFEASMAMAYIGTEAIPPLKEALTNSDAKIRLSAIETLGQMSSEADSVVPILIKCLHDKDVKVRFRAALSLVDFQGKSDLIAPIFIENIGDEDYRMRKAMILCLGKLGPAARIAFPAIRKALLDTNENVREEATNALIKIDPEAAAKVGVE